MDVYCRSFGGLIILYVGTCVFEVSQCFAGHILFEMAYGYELDTAHPGPQQLVGHQPPSVVEVKEEVFFFNNLICVVLWLR